MMNAKNKIILAQEFKLFFTSFEESGYGNYSHESKEMELVGEYVESVFYSSTKNRKITICYIERTENTAEVLSVYIENEVGDSFSITEYLKAQKITDTKIITSLLIGNHLGDFASRLNNCLGMYIEVIDDHLKNIVLGQEWETVPIDLE